MPQPSLPIGITAIFLALRQNMLLDVLKRLLVKGRIPLGHLRSEIDDPHIAGAARDVHAIAPWTKHVGIRPAVRIERQLQPCARQISRNIEGASLRISHEGHAQVLDKSSCPRQIYRSGGQIGVDDGHILFIQPQSIVAIPETDKRHPHRSAIDHPRLIAPGFKNSALCADTVKHFPVGTAAYRIRCDQTDPPRSLGLEGSKRLFKPVADKIRLPRDAAVKRTKQIFDNLVTELLAQQFRAKKRWIAKDELRLRPDGLGIRLRRRPPCRPNASGTAAVFSRRGSGLATTTNAFAVSIASSLRRIGTDFE